MAIIHIIGAGVSGLAAATKLAEAHLPVRLYEATAHAGGRARSSHHPKLGTIDHGLHFVDGNALELAAYLQRIGAQDSLTRVKHPLRLSRAPLMDYFNLLGLFLRRQGHAAGVLAEDNVLRHGWAGRASRLLLHTPLDALGAGASRRAARLQLAKGRLPSAQVATQSLSESFILPALAHLEYRGAGVYFNQPLKALERKDGRVTSLHFARQKISVGAEDLVILALPAAAVTQLLPEVTVTGEAHCAITVHYLVAHRQPEAVHAPDGAPVDLVRYRPGRISVAIRVADAVWHSDPEFLATRLWQWLGTQHADLPADCPPHAVWREKQAGHALTPERTVTIPPLEAQLLIAGDWCEADTPGSIEQAVASGHQAADRVIALVGQPRYRTQ